MKRKVIGILVALGMIAGMLAGCGKGGADVPQDKTQTDGNEEKNQEVEKITIYLRGNEYPDLDMVLEEVNKRARKEIGVEIDIKAFETGQWYQQYTLFLSGAEDFDILMNLGDFSNAVSQGAALDITELLEKYGQDIIALEGDYIKSGQLGGAQYAIPVYGSFTSAMGILYRADIVKALGLESQVAQVKSLEDWGKVLEAVKAAYPDMTPFVTNSGNRSNNFSNGSWDSLGDNYGVLMNGGATSKVENLFETEEYARLCRIMHEWYEKGYSSKDIQSQTDNFITLTRNDAAFSTLGKYDFNSATYNSTMIGKEIGAIGLGTSFSATYTNATWSIMSTSKHPEAAMKFLNLWYSDDEIADLLRYGIKDVHYKLDDNGMGTYMDGQDSKSCTFHLGASANNASGIRWNTEDPEYTKKLMDNNANCKKSVALGFRYDSTVVANEITQLGNVCSKYRIGLECGALDPEEYLPKFLKELKDAGIDTVIAEKQTQLDKWMKEK